MQRVWANLDYFLQTETRTRLFNINPNQNPVCDGTKYKNLNPAEPEVKTQTDPKPNPECLNPILNPTIWNTLHYYISN